MNELNLFGELAPVPANLLKPVAYRRGWIPVSKYSNTPPALKNAFQNLRAIPTSPQPRPKPQPQTTIPTPGLHPDHEDFYRALNGPCIVLTGSIIVFNERDRSGSSFIPGCLWPGSSMFPDENSLEYLEGTEIQPIHPNQLDTLTLEQALHASRLTGMWFNRWRHPPETRILTALDALGASITTQQLLAYVCGLARETVLEKLQHMTLAGTVERSTHNTRHILRIHPKLAGKFWPYRARTPQFH